MSPDPPESVSPSPAVSQGSAPHAQARPPERRPSASGEIPATLVPEDGWHLLHLFYRVDRARLAQLSPAQRGPGLDALRRARGE